MPPVVALLHSTAVGCKLCRDRNSSFTLGYLQGLHENARHWHLLRLRGRA
jgi:hypothetical protein